VDLLARTAELVGIPSESHAEAAITDHLEALLRAAPHLDVVRVGHNLVARTQLGRPMRVLLGGHTDTVPANDNLPARVDGDTVHGLGAADMKGGVAVLLELALAVAEPAVDVTYVFYECEEVEARYNGLGRIEREASELLACDAAVLAEPTSSRIEAGCQGTLRAVVTMHGTRAHTARAWMGVNAVHRLGAVLRRLDAYEPRTPVLDGCEFREGLQAVRVEGGVAGNVVPDTASVTLNHRFAPDRSPAEAEEHVRSVVGDVDGFEIVDAAPGAPPGLTHPLLAALVAAVGTTPTAKLGWTDVSRFAARGVPACNFGPGDPLLAHAQGECVDRADLERAHSVLAGLLLHGPTGASVAAP
jgi:succinyl-diaminopimelate desuccinylase